MNDSSVNIIRGLEQYQNQLFEKDVVAFATDSVCITKDLGINSTKLGKYTILKKTCKVHYLRS